LIRTPANPAAATAPTAYSAVTIPRCRPSELTSARIRCIVDAFASGTEGLPVALRRASVSSHACSLDFTGDRPDREITS